MLGSMAGFIGSPAVRLTPIGQAYAGSKRASKIMADVQHHIAAPNLKALRTMNQNKVVKAIGLTNPTIAMDMHLISLF